MTAPWLQGIYYSSWRKATTQMTCALSLMLASSTWNKNTYKKARDRNLSTPMVAGRMSHTIYRTHLMCAIMREINTKSFSVLDSRNNDNPWQWHERRHRIDLLWRRITAKGATSASINDIDYCLIPNCLLCRISACQLVFDGGVRDDVYTLHLA